MKATELIQGLATMIGRHGDLGVYFNVNGEDCDFMELVSERSKFEIVDQEDVPEGSEPEVVIDEADVFVIKLNRIEQEEGSNGRGSAEDGAPSLVQAAES